MNSNCPVCNTANAEETVVGGGNEYLWSCHRCGDFRLLFPSGDLPHMLKGDLRERAALSHWIRTEYEANRAKPTKLTGELVRDIIKNPRPDVTEQADNFIRWIGDNGKTFDEHIDVDKSAIQAIIGSATFDEFVIVFGHLRDKGVIQHQGGRDNVYARVRLSFLGWERYHELKQATSDSRKAFMAMQYNELQLEDIVDKVFRPAVAETGYALFVLRDNPKAGLIDDRLRAEIRAARFLIADLTHGNAGAYWEAGYAEGLGKPVIYTCEKKVFEDSQSRPHFDTNHHQTVLWDAGRPEVAAKELQVTICASLPGEAKLPNG